MAFKKKFSKTAKREFAQKMNEIEVFCKNNNISSSFSNDSYYFELNNQKYRISNHTVQASNRNAYTELGEKRRELYHVDGEQVDTIYITAGKTRLIEIYMNLQNGKKLDKRGFVIK